MCKRISCNAWLKGCHTVFDIFATLACPAILKHSLFWWIYTPRQHNGVSYTTLELYLVKLSSWILGQSWCLLLFIVLQSVESLQGAEMTRFTWHLLATFFKIVWKRMDVGYHMRWSFILILLTRFSSLTFAFVKLCFTNSSDDWTGVTRWFEQFYLLQ